MKCTTCGNDADLIGCSNNDAQVWHCMRCGTVRLYYPANKKVMDFQPKLVGYCRKLIENSWTTEAGLAHRIRKSVTPPEALTGGEK